MVYQSLWFLRDCVTEIRCAVPTVTLKPQASELLGVSFKILSQEIFINWLILSLVMCLSKWQTHSYLITYPKTLGSQMVYSIGFSYSDHRRYIDSCSNCRANLHVEYRMRKLASRFVRIRFQLRSLYFWWPWITYRLQPARC